MNRHIKIDPWLIVEEGFEPSSAKSSESLFSLGNGVMGGRGNFEEQYSGDTLRGSYIGGVYYPDKTRVGWWKNGYPEYFAKVLNSAFWVGIDVTVDGVPLDLATVDIADYRRELDMRHGVLRRRFTATLASGVSVSVQSERFISIVNTELGAIKYSITPLDGPAEIHISSYIDGDVRNEDSNYGESFWEKVHVDGDSITMRTKKTGFEVCWAMANTIGGVDVHKTMNSEAKIEHNATVKASTGQYITIEKFVGVASSLNHAAAEVGPSARDVATSAAARGFAAAIAEHSAAWTEKWASCDIEIAGDDAAQQGIRFCIFQLLQTYTGQDSRLNVGPKGFTGEKYGGSTYWDTEAYCLPFYLSTAGDAVGRQLLVYRYNQLDKAIENAAKLGFKHGAALYPMVTMNGEECHNEWEITFEEIHRNGAIAHAIYNYVNYTGDDNYLAECGLEVLIGIARFWSQRITYSEDRGQYVMLGVTGPNEYENNVNNNWYTNYLAIWCMRYAAEVSAWVREHHPADYARIVAARSFDEVAETERWQHIADNMYLPYDSARDIFLQQDGYLDKEQILVADLDPADRPLNQKWSWDRILRSCFIKQADVLQGLYFFEDDFDEQTIARNFRFYEERTVHESSLSPCVHAILAARIGDMAKAYEMYLRTSRLDLDDYNNEISEGLHITSMAGSWLSVVEGYGGMRVRDGQLTFWPRLPEQWKRLSFKVIFRGRVIRLSVDSSGTNVALEQGEPITVLVDGLPRPLL